MFLQHLSKSFILALGIIFFLSGCVHHIPLAFDEVNYVVSTQQFDEKVIYVIDENTLKNEFSVRSNEAGHFNIWDIQAGLMLKKIADVEFPQIFREYEFSTSLDKSQVPDKTIVVEMFIYKFDFFDFHTLAKIHFVAYGSGGKAIIDNLYIGEGEDQGTKVFWLGPYIMRSAIRQSTLDAYQKVFKAFREDLRNVLESKKDMSIDKIQIEEKPAE